MQGPDYRELKEQAYEANMEIPRQHLALYTWGNVSAFDPERGVFAIKPSGVEYDKLSPDSMVIVDLDGRKVEGSLNPSSDTATHRVLYREFPGVWGICHTHSTFAVAWSQAHRSVPVFGTTHADHGALEIPCTEFMSEEAVKNNYELETGNLIVETFRKEHINPADMSMVLVAGHGPFAWGENAGDAVYHASVLEEVCKMAYLTVSLDGGAASLPEHIIRKHWERKHGPNAYYGQR
ncbi:L-ribulose-5-phosphate 4-epimerase [Spirochaetia bacterium]|nr:L-ribulose-5-phosphate 4-epimerase [Spirochaetia bacterium]